MSDEDDDDEVDVDEAAMGAVMRGVGEEAVARPCVLAGLPRARFAVS